jgi:peroxiredoxin
VPLPASDGSTIDLSVFPGRAVVFAYPRTARPDDPPGEDWNSIPGARGCTPEMCSVRDEHGAFAARDVAVFGLSAQSVEDVTEAAGRLGLPYPLLSDAGGDLTDALRLPTFEWRGRRLIKRLTLFLADGRIEDVIYPVFPPDGAAAAALERLGG